MLDRLGLRERVEWLLGPRFMALLNIRFHQYKELVLGYHSTFQYKEGNFGE